MDPELRGGLRRRWLPSGSLAVLAARVLFPALGHPSGGSLCLRSSVIFSYFSSFRFRFVPFSDGNCCLTLARYLGNVGNNRMHVLLGNARITWKVSQSLHRMHAVSLHTRKYPVGASLRSSAPPLTYRELSGRSDALGKLGLARCPAQPVQVQLLFFFHHPGDSIVFYGLFSIAYVSSYWRSHYI